MAEIDVKTFDYSFVDAIARVALYDDMKSAPRITKVEPAATDEYIEKHTVRVYEKAKIAEGKHHNSIIREENEK